MEFKEIKGNANPEFLENQNGKWTRYVSPGMDGIVPVALVTLEIFSILNPLDSYLSCWFPLVIWGYTPCCPWAFSGEYNFFIFPFNLSAQDCEPTACQECCILSDGTWTQNDFMGTDPTL